MTAADVIARYRRYGWSATTGEWGMIQEQTRRSFHDALDAGDEQAVGAMLASLFQKPPALGLLSFDHRDDDDETNARLARYMDTNLRLWGGWDVSILRAPDAGAPVCVAVNGIPVMFDTPRHDHYARQIVQLLPEGGTVLEIGGGYGGMALQLQRRSRDIRVVLVDLPETLYLAWYWLDAAGVLVSWHDTNPHASVVLLPWTDLAEWTGKTDLVFASHSLSEMDAATCAAYVAWIETRKPRWFYHDNATHMVRATGDGESTTSELYPETLANQLIPRGYRKRGERRMDWPLTGNRYCEFLYEVAA